MSFSSRRRNYLLTPHRRDGLIEWMKSMLHHSFVLDSLETTAVDTFEHFELLIDEHRAVQGNPLRVSRLQQLVPTIGIFHTHLPLRTAFEVYNTKHKLTKRKHIQISFNEIRHILNLAQIMALRPFGEYPETSDADTEESLSEIDNKKQENETLHSFNGPKLICFDGDQTLYSDGANFESNPRLAHYLYQLLKNKVTVAIVTAAGYEYNKEKYEFRLSGLLHYFQSHGLSQEECDRFFLFGGECNYLLRLGADYGLHAVKENGPGGWCTAARSLKDSPGNWNEAQVKAVLDLAQESVETTKKELNLRARTIRKRRSVGLVPNNPGQEIPRESLDETVLRVQERLQKMNDGAGASLPYCAFNGGSDCWVDVGNKAVGVEVLQSYIGVSPNETLHIGDQFLNTGNDVAARTVCPCVWIINPQETTYILKSILRLAGVSHELEKDEDETEAGVGSFQEEGVDCLPNPSINFEEMERRTEVAKKMDVYTGEMISSSSK